MITADCPHCEKKTEFNHVHNTAHGIPETHMAGSERFICKECKHPFYKHEGEKLGFRYVLD